MTYMETLLESLILVSASNLDERLKAGGERGWVTARATELARDPANASATLFTARHIAEIASIVGKGSGLDVEVLDEKALAKLGCGGMLGVNAGSAEPPRLVKLI